MHERTPEPSHLSHETHVRRTSQVLRYLHEIGQIVTKMQMAMHSDLPIPLSTVFSPVPCFKSDSQPLNVYTDLSESGMT